MSAAASSSSILQRIEAPVLSRREWLRVGGLTWLGVGLSDLLRLRSPLVQAASTRNPRPIRSVILAFCPGGPSHLETFDPKPDAPKEIRGEFGTIATALPGVRFGEHSPRLAACLDRMTLVRSMTTTTPVHELAVHRLLGGVDEAPPGTGVAASRKDRPHLGALIAACRSSARLSPQPDGLPHAVTLPTRLTFEGAVFPGQNAGFLGPKLDPWHFVGDPNAPGFAPQGLVLPDSLSIARLRSRQELLRDLEQARRTLDGIAAWDDSGMGMGVGVGSGPDEFRRQALAILTSGACRRAFDLDEEDPRTRDRYGRTLMGQGLLLGRRLAEAGVPLVQVNLGDSNVWDTHKQNFKRLRDDLLPPFDQAVSALVEDLAARGLNDEVLVIVTGEFGRTPRVGMPIKGGAGAEPDGRDHWPGVFSLLAFGAGTTPGLVLGASDRTASHPASPSYRPADLAATILDALGVPTSGELRDPLNRPFAINSGSPIPWG